MNVHTAESLVDFAEETSRELRGYDGRALLDQLDRRYDDLVSAIRWFLAHGRADKSLRLVSALVPFWMATKRLDEGSKWLQLALALPGGKAAYRGKALFDAGYMAFWQGDDARSSSFQNLALELGRQTNNPTVSALALVGLARIALRTDVEEARRLCREALAITEGTNDRMGRSSAMHVLGVAAQMAGDFLEARELMSRRIAMAREEGNVFVVGSESGNLSMVERQLGNLNEAEALAQEALEIAYRRGDELAFPWMVNGIVAVAVDRGEFDRGATLVGVADARLEAAGGAWPPDELVHYERSVATLTEAMGAAAFEQARSVGRSMTMSEAFDFALGAHLVG
jgi:tetratricopeptide (TPR) repeat protein